MKEEQGLHNYNYTYVLSEMLISENGTTLTCVIIIFHSHNHYVNKTTQTTFLKMTIDRVLEGARQVHSWQELQRKLEVMF